jgi:hypothetical protein
MWYFVGGGEVVVREGLWIVYLAVQIPYSNRRCTASLHLLYLERYRICQLEGLLHFILKHSISKIQPPMVTGPS